MASATVIKDNISLEEFMANPPERMEWVDGQLVEKNGMTLRHGQHPRLKHGGFVPPSG